MPSPSLIFGLPSVQQYCKIKFYLKLPNSKFKFDFVSEETVLKLPKDLDENKAAGLDNVPGKFFKDGGNSLAKPISQISDLSINYSVFPPDCKIGKFKSLFKKVLKLVPKNYLPISLLPTASKIIQKAIHDQTQSFQTKMILFTDIRQVLENLFPLICLSYLNNKIAAGFECSLYTGLILIDS